MSSYSDRNLETLGELLNKMFSQDIGRPSLIEIIEAICAGKYDYLLEYNPKEIRKITESGKLSDDKKVGDYAMRIIGGDARFLFDCIEKISDIMYYRHYLYDLISEQKRNFTYDENDYSADLNSRMIYRRPIVRYKEALEMIHRVEKISGNKRLYIMLDHFLKNDAMIEHLYRREKSIKSDKSYEDVHKILRTPDDNIGIIIIKDSENGTSVVAGTKKDIELSNLIGYPYPRDIDEPYNEYSDHLYSCPDPRKVEKEFIEATDPRLCTEHLRMIENEKARRAKMKATKTSGKMGFVDGMIITERELLDSGIDPTSLGWEPLKTNPSKLTLYKLYREDGYDFRRGVEKTRNMRKLIRKAKKNIAN